jgi:hypothetical protein
LDPENVGEPTSPHAIGQLVCDLFENGVEAFIIVARFSMKSFAVVQSQRCSHTFFFTAGAFFEPFFQNAQGRKECSPSR